MKKLQTLGQRISTLNFQRAPTLTTKNQRITGSTLQKIRERVLRRAKGLCECAECRAPGAIPKRADYIDHIQPLWEGGVEDPHDDSNRQALAKECHDKKSAEEAKRRAGQ